jgi:hypothetical protein
MIISASRRTDIPAFYSEWFMNRIREGIVHTRNPFNKKQIKKTSLVPADVDAIVFWTRNPVPLIPALSELNERSFFYYFLYTITGYPVSLETKTPPLGEAINTFQKLSDIVGPDRVMWRFDPVVISRDTPAEEIQRLFEFIARALRGYSHKVIISFLNYYPKIRKHLQIAGVQETMELPAILNISKSLVEIAAIYGFNLQSCAQNINLNGLAIKQGSCIDGNFIEKFSHTFTNFNRDTNQRKECFCVKSIDIGAYNTCLHGCVYCYASRSEHLAMKNFSLHNPQSPFLVDYNI